MNSGIYGIFGPNDMVYVGYTNNFSRRKREHFGTLRNGTHVCHHLKNAFIKYGESNFKFRILEVTEPEPSVLSAREAFWVASFIGDSENPKEKVYNITNKVGVEKLLTSDETLARMSASKMGHHVSEETKKKMSDAAIGRKKSAEHCASMSAARKGTKLSEETKAKISERSRNISEETREKLSAAGRRRMIETGTIEKLAALNRGRKHSEETRLKLSERVFSAEHRAKLSSIQIGRKNTPERIANISQAKLTKKMEKLNQLAIENPDQFKIEMEKHIKNQLRNERIAKRKQEQKI